MACERLGARGRIYVPGTTPRQKRDRIQALGGDRVEVIVVGDSYDEAFVAAQQDAVRSGATLVPAFDDPRTICGQGTVAHEIVDQLGFAPDRTMTMSRDDFVALARRVAERLGPLDPSR